MKKLLAFAAFALVTLAATSAHAQTTTISPVPGGQDTPHENMATKSVDQSAYGKQRSDGQQMPANRSQFKKQKMTNGSSMSMSDKKEARKQMKMQKQADKAGSM